MRPARYFFIIQLSNSRALDEMNHHETLKLIVNAVLAALAIGGVFLGAVYLFLLFCVQVWFK